MPNKSIPISVFTVFLLLLLFSCSLFFFLQLYPCLSLFFRIFYVVSLLSRRHEVKKITKRRNVQMISSIFICPLVSVVFLCHYDNVRNIKYWITSSKKHYKERKESNGRPYFFPVFFFGIASLSSKRWGTKQSKLISRKKRCPLNRT